LTENSKLQPTPVYEGKSEELVKERRRQIFEASASVFASKGYHSATVSEIAREAGLGKGTIYEYVRSKKELLFLVIEEGHNMVFEQLDRIIDSGIDPEKKWREALRAQLGVLEAHKEAARALIPAVKGLEQTDRQWMERLEAEYIGRFQRIFEEGIQDGIFREVDSYLVCKMACICCLDWNDSETVRRRCQDSIDNFETLLADIFINGVRK